MQLYRKLQRKKPSLLIFWSCVCVFQISYWQIT